ncbi:MAG: rhodanese-like domain-containing protein [Sandaracinaceae bacterium]|nr:rhodanese-like domain-containing protein [Myxococcales bacterium]MCB9660969.1 rhodanese-like domain-containing protein [Sandaracinaceae bacterium]
MSWFTRTPSPSNDRARQLVADGALLLDVRTPAEFAEGHVEGALNIPVQELGARMGEIRGRSNVVVYCKSGGRSCAAAGMLEKAGHHVLDVGAMRNY